MNSQHRYPGIGIIAAASLWTLFWAAPCVLAQGGQGAYLTEASQGLVEMIDKANKEGFRFADDQFSIGGGWLLQGVDNWVSLYTIQLDKDKEYRVLAVGDDDARDVDLKVLDAKGMVVARDETIDPSAMVTFRAPRTENYTVQVRLFDSRENVPSLCLAIVMERPAGKTEPFGAQGKYLAQASQRLAKVIASANNDGYRFSNDQFSIGGGWLKQSQTSWISLYAAELGVKGEYRVLASGDNDAKDVDVRVLYPKGHVKAGEPLVADVTIGATALVNLQSPKTDRYPVQVRLNESDENVPCLCLAIVMKKANERRPRR